MKDLGLRAAVVARTLHIKILRRRLADYVKTKNSEPMKILRGLHTHHTNLKHWPLWHYHIVKQWPSMTACTLYFIFVQYWLTSKCFTNLSLRSIDVTYDLTFRASKINNELRIEKVPFAWWRYFTPKTRMLCQNPFSFKLSSLLGIKRQLERLACQ